MKESPNTANLENPVKESPNTTSFGHPSTKESLNTTSFELPSTKESLSTTGFELPSTKESLNSTGFELPSTKGSLDTASFELPSVKEPPNTASLKRSTSEESQDSASFERASTKESLNTASFGHPSIKKPFNTASLGNPSVITLPECNSSQASLRVPLTTATFTPSSSNFLDTDKTLSVKRSPFLGNKRRIFRSSALSKLNVSNVVLPSSNLEHSTKKENNSHCLSIQDEVNGQTNPVQETVKNGQLGNSKTVTRLEGEGLTRDDQRDKKPHKPSKCVVSSLSIKLSAAGKALDNDIEANKNSDSETKEYSPLKDQASEEERAENDAFFDMEQDLTRTSVEQRETKFLDRNEYDVPNMDDKDMALDEKFESGKYDPRVFPKSALHKRSEPGRAKRHVILDPQVVLLDAAVEGELETVKDVITKVCNFHLLCHILPQQSTVTYF